MRIDVNGNVGIGTTTTGTPLTVAGPISLQEPSTPACTANAYTVNVTTAPFDSSLTFNDASGCTVTLPAVATYPGQILLMSNNAAGAIVSASSNVFPQGSTTAGTAILPATVGAWALLQDNGSDWVIMGSGTGGNSTALNNVTAATGNQAGISNGANTIIWNWALSTATTGLTLANTDASASTATTLAATSAVTGAGSALNATMTGTSNTGYAGYFSNAPATNAGANWGVYGTNSTTAALTTTTGASSAVAGLMTGTTNTGAAGYFSNATTGTGYGIYSIMNSAGTSSGYAGYFYQDPANVSTPNYGIYSANNTNGSLTVSNGQASAVTAWMSGTSNQGASLYVRQDTGSAGYGIYVDMNANNTGYSANFQNSPATNTHANWTVYATNSTTATLVTTTGGASAVAGLMTGASNAGAAVYGDNSGTTDVGYAGYFIQNPAMPTSANWGVYSTNNNTGTFVTTTGASSAVAGLMTGASNTGAAVFGINSGTTNTGYGGYFNNTGGGAALGVNGFMTMVDMAAPTVSAAGTARIYFDSTSFTLMSSTNGGAYAALGGCTTIDCLADAINNNTSGSLYMGSLDAAYHTTGAASEFNAAVGQGALVANTSGASNTAVGYQALNKNTTGAHNTAVGQTALAAVVAGAYNTAVGHTALASMTGFEGTGIGFGALESDTSGGYNTALGFQAGYTGATGAVGTTTGTYNTFVGYQASANANNLVDATALGDNAVATASHQIMYGATTVTDNEFNGALTIADMAAPAVSPAGTARIYFDSTSFTLQVSNNGGAYAAFGGCTTIDCLADAINNTTSGSTYVGSLDAAYHTTGAASEENVAVGQTALVANTSGSQNTAIGYGAETTSTTAIGNTGLGYHALHADTTGGYNTALGMNALNTNQTGTGNVAIGYQSGLNINASNNTAVGVSALGTTQGAAATYNTGLGVNVLYGNTTGGSNTGVGAEAGYTGATGAIANTVGTLDTFIGYQSAPNANNLTDATALGANAVVTCSDCIQLGDSGVTTVFLGSGSAQFALVAGSAPTYGTFSLTSAVSGILPVANGGTGIAAGTQYGLPYFSTTTLMASTGAGTATTFLQGNASGAPTWASVNVATEVTGILPVANGGTGTGTLIASMGTCTVTAFTISTTATAEACTGVPTGSAVSCSPTVSQGNEVWSTWRATAGHVTFTSSGGTPASSSWVCMWIDP
jgi:hypothetical protein